MLFVSESPSWGFRVCAAGSHAFCAYYLEISLALPEFSSLRRPLLFNAISAECFCFSFHFSFRPFSHIFNWKTGKIGSSVAFRGLIDFMVLRRVQCIKLYPHARNVLLRERNPD